MLAIIAALVAASVSLCCAPRVQAQSFSPTINPTAPPIVIQTTPEKVAVRPTVSDQKIVNIAFGATVNGGNTKSYAGNLGGRFGLIRDQQQLMVEALGTLGGARQGKIADVEWTSRNVIARARYDRFLSQYDALFVAMGPRRDTFAGLKLRLQNQVGYLRNLYFPSDAHRVWVEGGYDFTYDNIGELQGNTAMMPPPSDKKDDKFIHSARVFFGYTNRLSQTANLSLGVENLFDFVTPGNYRVNGLVELTSSITQTFKLGLQSRIMYDRKPVTGAEPYDAVAVAQLVYTFDSLAGRVISSCPACDCTALVQAARASCRPAEASQETRQP